jgi:hypothetical protein
MSSCYPIPDVSGLMLRTLLRAELRLPRLQMALEMQDARAFAPGSTSLSTSIVNAFEPLEAWVGTRFDDVFMSDDSVELRAGRMTLDVGSRRLLARNDFRNTINGFTAISGTWRIADGPALRIFGGMPVTRLPSTPGDLASNAVALDEENTSAWVFGVFADGFALGDGFQFQLFALGLVEHDRAALPSANRRIATLSARLLRPPAPGRFDVEVELIGQIGRSHASNAATDTRDLAHRAFAGHLSAGVTFTGRFAPRLHFMFDLASGDDDPNDAVQGRFDTLFGARRFDFGPTGLHGLLARANLASPGLRLDFGLPQVFDFLAAWRPAWLATSADAWVGIGPRPAPATARNGSFVGHHLEARVRWFILPGNLALEAGFAALLGGELGLHPNNPAIFAYTQFTIHI